MTEPPAPSSRVLASPLVVLGVRDCGWLEHVLSDLLKRGYFDALPALKERASSLRADLGEVAISGQLVAGAPSTAHDGFMTYGEAAQKLGCSVRTVRRRVADGSLPVVVVGGTRRVQIPPPNGEAQ